MDLVAFKNIERLSEIAEANGIEVPRLRGYYYMGTAEAFTEEEIEEEVASCRDALRGMHYDLSDIYYKVNETRTQCETHNKYVGRKDVLKIHSRMGGREYPIGKDDNGDTIYKDIADEPWFLEHVYDGFDSTYCDIYAKIVPPE